MVEIVPCWRGLWDRKVQKLTALFRNPSAELMQFIFFHLGYLNRNKGDNICWLIRDRWAWTHPLAGYISPSFGPPVPRASGREALVLLRKRKIPPHLLHVGRSPTLSSSYPWHRAYSPTYPTPWITIIQIKKLHWSSKEASNLCLFMRGKAFESQKVLKKCRSTIQSCSGSSPHRTTPHMWHPTSNFRAFPHQLGMLSHQPSSLSMGMKRRIQLSQLCEEMRWDLLSLLFTVPGRRKYGQTQQNSGPTSLGLKILWLCCFLGKMDSPGLGRLQNLISKPSDLLCNSVTTHWLPLACYATLGKLIYFSELDSLSVKQRFACQGVVIHLVIREILLQLLLSPRQCSRCWWWSWTNVWTTQGTVQHTGAKQIMTAITLTIANEFCHEKQLELKDVSAFYKYKALCRH